MEIHIGKVTHFYSHICVAVVKLSGEITRGDLIHILGYTTDYVQRVKSMEIEHQPVHSVPAGGEVALKVLGPVRKGDLLYKIPETEADQTAPESQSFFEADR